MAAGRAWRLSAAEPWWRLVEVLGTQVEWRESKELASEPGPTWPKLEAPPTHTDVRFAMSVDGDISWRFGADRLEGPLAALPERAPDGADVLPALGTKGTSHISVNIADRFGRPLENAEDRAEGRSRSGDGVGCRWTGRAPRPSRRPVRCGGNRGGPGADCTASSRSHEFRRRQGRPWCSSPMAPHRQ